MNNNNVSMPMGIVSILFIFAIKKNRIRKMTNAHENITIRILNVLFFIKVQRKIAKAKYSISV